MAFVIIGLLVGLASLLGVGHVRMGEHMVTGWLALPTALVTTFFMGCLFAAIATVFGFLGLWVFSKFSDLRLDLVTSSNTAPLP
jgi:F0F1-type ATP synthase membrane subunit c/vacuolar-type H+-ATPase subunit K